MKTPIEIQQELCDKLREEMHNVPMNKMFKDHTGHRHLGSHDMAWAKTSRAWCEARAKLLEMEKSIDISN